MMNNQKKTAKSSTKPLIRFLNLDESIDIEFKNIKKTSPNINSKKSISFD